MSGAKDPSNQRLRDFAAFVRSKNSGPFMLTIDIFFDSADDCKRVVESRILSPEKVAAIYRVDPATIITIHVVPANALKISLPRPLAAGDPGDSDVAGGQQFAPLLDIEVPSP